MSIYSNKGKVEIKGEVGDILADLSMITYVLREAETPECLIKSAVDNGLETYKNKKLKESKDARVNSILKKFGLEV